MPDGMASLESALAITSSAFGHDSLTSRRSVAQRAVDLEREPNRHRAVALELLGVALMLEGDFPGARDVLQEAVRLDEDTSTGAISLAHLALISLREGGEGMALRQARRAHAIVELPRMRANLSSLATYSVLAHLLARRGDLGGAAAAVERVNALLPRATEAFWWLMIETGILLAPVLVALDRGGEAVTQLEEAGVLLAEHTDAGKLHNWYAETLQQLHLAPHHRPRQQATEALSDAERRVLRLLASNLSLSEIGRELYLSVNTVKTHRLSIYRKLGVSSRADAVRAARTEAHVL